MIKLKDLLYEGMTLPWNIDYTKLPVETYRSEGYWISPNTKVYNTEESHAEFAKKYLYPDLDYDDAREKAIKDGWIRLRTHPTQGIMELDALNIKPEQLTVAKDFAKRQRLKLYKGRLNENYNTIRDESELELTPVDNWKATDAMYLEDMGFKNDGMYYYASKKPAIRISHKKNEGFIVEDKTSNKTNKFAKFKELEEYFAKYEQKWDNSPYQSN